jgi:hypothetical protein
MLLKLLSLLGLLLGFIGALYLYRHSTPTSIDFGEIGEEGTVKFDPRYQRGFALVAAGFVCQFIAVLCS